MSSEKVVNLIFDTLSALASKGLAGDLVEASMNTVEFRFREQNTGSYPRGLFLMLASLDTWLHGGNPFDPLAFEAPLQGIKDRLHNGEKVFENFNRGKFSRKSTPHDGSTGSGSSVEVAGRKRRS